MNDILSTCWVEDFCVAHKRTMLEPDDPMYLSEWEVLLYCKRALEEYNNEVPSVWETLLLKQEVEENYDTLVSDNHKYFQDTDASLFCRNLESETIPTLSLEDSK